MEKEMKWFRWFDQKTWSWVSGEGTDIYDAIRRYREANS